MCSISSIRSKRQLVIIAVTFLLISPEECLEKRFIKCIIYADQKEKIHVPTIVLYAKISSQHQLITRQLITRNRPIQLRCLEVVVLVFANFQIMPSVLSCLNSLITWHDKFNCYIACSAFGRKTLPLCSQSWTYGKAFVKIPHYMMFSHHQQRCQPNLVVTYFFVFTCRWRMVTVISFNLILVVKVLML